MTWPATRACRACSSAGPTLAARRVVPVDPAAFNHVTHEILGAAIEVHRTLGPQRPIPLTYKGHLLDESYRVDLVVEGVVVVEVKAVVAMPPVYQAQTLTYMRLMECPAGLLINFNVPKLMDGVKRLINPRAK